MADHGTAAMAQGFGRSTPANAEMIGHQLGATKADTDPMIIYFHL
jgi:hypothetical protein